MSSFFRSEKARTLATQIDYRDVKHQFVFRLDSATYVENDDLCDVLRMKKGVIECDKDGNENVSRVRGPARKRAGPRSHTVYKPAEDKFTQQQLPKSVETQIIEKKEEVKPETVSVDSAETSIQSVDVAKLHAEQDKKLEEELSSDDDLKADNEDFNFENKKEKVEKKVKKKAEKKIEKKKHGKKKKKLKKEDKEKKKKKPFKKRKSILDRLSE